MEAYGSIPQPLHLSLVDTHGPFSFVASIVSFGILLLDVYLHHFYNVPWLNNTWVTSCPMLAILNKIRTYTSRALALSSTLGIHTSYKRGQTRGHYNIPHTSFQGFAAATCPLSTHTFHPQRYD